MRMYTSECRIGYRPSLGRREHARQGPVGNESKPISRVTVGACRFSVACSSSHSYSHLDSSTNAVDQFNSVSVYECAVGRFEPDCIFQQVLLLVNSVVAGSIPSLLLHALLKVVLVFFVVRSNEEQLSRVPFVEWAVRYLGPCMVHAMLTARKGPWFLSTLRNWVDQPYCQGCEVTPCFLLWFVNSLRADINL